jgi:hypothetical protein
MSVIKAARDLKPGDRLLLSSGSALIVDMEPLPEDRILFTFLAGTEVAVDADLTVRVLDADEWNPW